ncbi:MAG: VCBS repeat-containing protein [Cyclobacteriaceae bacterium]
MPKRLWAKTVLPAMGSFYGIKTKGFGLLQKHKPGELEIIKNLGIYPGEQVLSDSIWYLIQEYYTNNSPDEFVIDKSRKKRTKNLKGFDIQEIKLNELPGSLISTLNFDPESKKVLIGEDRSMAYSWQYPNQSDKIIQTNSTVSHLAVNNDTTYIVEMGSLTPTEKSTGTISILNGSTIISGLNRPVHAIVSDLNADGQPEIVVCNYGNKTGRLSIFSKLNGSYTESVIHQQAGALKSFLNDMNDDGDEDLITMFAQGDESIYIFYNKGNLQFESERILRFSPLMGSNDFDMVDYDQDGDLDIIVAQGDNADITVTPKPYHGIRLFINEKNIFEEKYFFPLYGATKVLAHDFDKDGDMDIVATAFYQEYNILPNEGLIYLENVHNENFEFEAFSFKFTSPVKSYTLAKGDIDNDGDMDIITGHFSYSITKAPKELKELWQKADYDLTILINKIK